MGNMQRIRNDLKTDIRREATDKALSKKRDENDSLTQEKRYQADKTLEKNREKNDIKTFDRRTKKDAKEVGVLGVFFLALITLTIGTIVITLVVLSV